MGLRNGKLSDTLTLYYDPILRYDHRRGPESALMMAVYLAPQKPEVAELIFAAGAERLGWTTGEFTWGFGLNEPHPRGQFNATRMMAEPLFEGTWRRLFNAPNLRKFSQPTVHGVDFPTVCLSQACYDAARGLLIVATDAGLPRAAGQPTTFRVANLDPASCRVEIDGRTSDDWRIVEGDLEITTTVAEHLIRVTHERPIA